MTSTKDDKKPKLVSVFVWHLSLLVFISLNLRRLALRLGWLKNIQNHG